MKNFQKIVFWAVPDDALNRESCIKQMNAYLLFLRNNVTAIDDTKPVILKVFHYGLLGNRLSTESLLKTDEEMYQCLVGLADSQIKACKSVTGDEKLIEFIIKCVSSTGNLNQLPLLRDALLYIFSERIVNEVVSPSFSLAVFDSLFSILRTHNKAIRYLSYKAIKNYLNFNMQHFCQEQDCNMLMELINHLSRENSFDQMYEIFEILEIILTKSNDKLKQLVCDFIVRTLLYNIQAPADEVTHSLKYLYKLFQQDPKLLGAFLLKYSTFLSKAAEYILLCPKNPELRECQMSILNLLVALVVDMPSVVTNKFLPILLSSADLISFEYSNEGSVASSEFFKDERVCKLVEIIRLILEKMDAPNIEKLKRDVEILNKLKV